MSEILKSVKGSFCWIVKLGEEKQILKRYDKLQNRFKARKKLVRTNIPFSSTDSDFGKPIEYSFDDNYTFPYEECGEYMTKADKFMHESKYRPANHYLDKAEKILDDYEINNPHRITKPNNITLEELNKRKGANLHD